MRRALAQQFVACLKDHGVQLLPGERPTAKLRSAVQACRRYAPQRAPAGSQQ